MITEIEVKNYKSLHHFKMEVGRFNVLIGENGCGKSNILEAITLAGAADADRLDEEFLVPRGGRVTKPQFMRSAFELNEENINIVLRLKDYDTALKYVISNGNENYSQWKIIEESQAKIIKEFCEKTAKRQGKIIEDFFEKIEESQLKIRLQLDFDRFVIYSPENTALRKFEQEGQLQPLGINGEGLLKLLKVIQQKSMENKEDEIPFDEIQQSLELFGWYESMEVSNDFSQLEQKITIKDQYLEDAFDQRSANEGFLFVLFYIALIVSKDTPKIFAIDNIDASLNPKLCTKLITELTRLAKKYDKQVFVTTHNPAILDGIDLGDDEQRLLVVSRNKQGHTRCKRIGLEEKPRSSTDEPLALSEAFLRGDLGGLPKGF